MSGVACATPVTPSLPSSRLGARLPVGERLPRADGTSRQKILWCVSAQDTPLAGRHKKTGCHPRKISIRGPRNVLIPYNGISVGKGLITVRKTSVSIPVPGMAAHSNLG